MKTKIFFYLAVFLLVTIASCYEDQDSYYVSFEVDGRSWDLNEDNGTFKSHTVLGLFDNYWECDWTSEDKTLTFGIYCDPAPDHLWDPEDEYYCDVYLYDEKDDTRYESDSGFSLTATYSDSDDVYKGTFSGSGIKTPDGGAYGSESVSFSKGKFELEHN